MNHRGKVFKILLYVLAAAAAVILLFLLCKEVREMSNGSDAMPMGNLRGYRFGEKSLNEDFAKDGRYEIPAGKIDRVYIEWHAGGVEVMPCNGSSVILLEKGAKPISKENRLRYGADDANIAVKYSSDDATVTEEKTLTVKIPETMKNRLEVLAAETASAPVTITGMNPRKLGVKTMSADVSVKECSLKSADIKTLSGDITCEKCKITDGKVETGAGKVDVHGKIGDVYVKTVAGEINIISDKMPDGFRVETVSGDTNLYLGEVKSFAVTYNTGHGDFYSDFKVQREEKSNIYTYRNGHGSDEHTVSSSSGNFRILKKQAKK